MKSIEKVFAILSLAAALTAFSCQFNEETQAEDGARLEESDGGRYLESHVIMTSQ